MKKIHNRVFVMLSVLILMLAVMIGGLWILESAILRPGQEELPAVSKTITRNGVDYFPRQDITTLLVMGIDETGPVEDSGSYRNTGEADVVMLIIFEEKSESHSILILNRDTMLEMPVLGLGGKQAGTICGQLALSHTYGNGLADSCENTCKTVSDFLGGVRIDYYVAMNMDAIAIANDAVGGVTVTVKDDFSKVNAGIALGEFTLQGDQVIDYVCTRKDVGDQKNTSRMERQKEYLEGFQKALIDHGNRNAEFALRLYEQVSPYMVTDCSSATLGGMLERYMNFAIREIVTPEGDNRMGEEHYEFYPDKDKLNELILRIFYAPKK